MSTEMTFTPEFRFKTENSRKKILLGVWSFCAFIALLGSVGFTIKLLMNDGSFELINPYSEEAPFQVKFFANFAIFIFGLAFVLPWGVGSIQSLLNKQTKKNWVVNIIRYSLLLSICSFGAISNMSTKALASAIPFFALSLIGLLIVFPRSREYELGDKELQDLYNLKQNYPETPKYIQIPGLIILIIGFLAGAIPYLQKINTIPENLGTVATYLGALGTPMILLGAMGFQKNYLQKKSPKVFWGVLVIALISATVSIASITKKQGGCLKECELMHSSGELAEGMSVESCAKKLCQ